MKCLRIVVGLLFMAGPNLVSAGQIGIGNFTATAILQNFESLGAGSTEQASTLIIGADTFRTDDDRLRSSSKFGPVIGRAGVALSNSPGSSSAPVGFIDISLGIPAFRAGLYVGFQFPWVANVEFYSSQDDLLGTLVFSGSGGDNGFAAWQADADRIQRIRVTDAANEGSPIIIDDFIQEVPEPGSLLLLSLGVIGSFGCRQR